MSPIRRMWHGTKWGRLLIVGPYIAVVLTSAGVTWRLHDQQVRSCHQRRDDRTVLRALVVKAYSTSTPTFDLTNVPGFSDLDNPTRQYLTNLSVAINSSSNRDQTEKAVINIIPPITC